MLNKSIKNEANFQIARVQEERLIKLIVFREGQKHATFSLRNAVILVCSGITELQKSLRIEYKPNDLHLCSNIFKCCPVVKDYIASVKGECMSMEHHAPIFPPQSHMDLPRIEPKPPVRGAVD